MPPPNTCTYFLIRMSPALIYLAAFPFCLFAILHFPSSTAKVSCSLKKQQSYLFFKANKKALCYFLFKRCFHQFPKSTWPCNMEFQTKGKTPWVFGLQTFPRIGSKFVYRNPLHSAAFMTSFWWYAKRYHDKITFTRLWNRFKFSIVFHFAELDGLRILPVSLGGEGVRSGKVFRKRDTIWTRQLRPV